MFILNEKDETSFNNDYYITYHMITYYPGHNNKKKNLHFYTINKKEKDSLLEVSL